MGEGFGYSLGDSLAWLAPIIPWREKKLKSACRYARGLALLCAPCQDLESIRARLVTHLVCLCSVRCDLSLHARTHLVAWRSTRVATSCTMTQWTRPIAGVVQQRASEHCICLACPRLGCVSCVTGILDCAILPVRRYSHAC